jgi:uncharacterized protein (TIGR03663 family)
MLDVDQQAPEKRRDEFEPVDEALLLAPDPALDRPLVLGQHGGEILAWAGILLTGALLRLASLGTDALSPEGGRHAYAAYALLRGSGTALDSASGGPFGVLFGALLLFLFGVSDQVVRLGPVLAGIGTVALAIPLRPYLGRAGALVAGLLLAISPSVVYFSRLELPDAYAAFFATLLFVALLRACDGARRGGIVLLGATAALLFVSAPVGLSLLLILLAATLLVPFALRGGRGDRIAFVHLRAAGREGWLPAVLLALALLLLIFSAFGAVPGNLAVGPLDWLRAWGHSLSGSAGGGRGPLFALGLLLLYEPLALIAGSIGLIRLFARPRGAREQPQWRASKRNSGRHEETAAVTHEQAGGLLARGLLAFWALVGAILLAIGGGTQPQLVLLASVPLCLLGGATLGDLLERIDWRRDGAFWTGGAGTILCAALALAAWGATLGQILQPSRIPDETGRLLTLLMTVVLFALPLTGAALWFARRIEPGAALRALAFGFALFLLGFGFRTAVGLSIYRADAANEPLVYNASTPEVRPLMERILRLSRDLTALNRTVADPTGGHGLSVAIDPGVEWPTRWYLRDFPNMQVIPTNTLGGGASGAATPPQLLFRPGDGKPATPGDYTPQTYKLTWSYPADQALTGAERPFLRRLNFLVFRNNVAPAASTNMTVEYGSELAQRLTLPPSSQGPFNLTDRAGQGRAPGQFDSPRGMAFGPDGSLYVVDMRNARVQQFAADGTFVRQFGSLGHNDGQLWRESSRGPTGIAVGADGAVYVADTWNYRVQKFTADGQFVAKWGTYVNLVTGQQGADRTGLYGPRGIALGANGDVYVTDTGNARVVVYGPDGAFRREFGTKGTGPSQLDEPVGIAVSADGTRVYVADSSNARIGIFDAQGQPVAQWAVAEWRGKSYYEPYLALDAGGALCATSSATRQVLKFNANGQVVARSSGGTAPADTFSAPFGIAIDKAGQIYVSDGTKNFVTPIAPFTGP